MGETLKDTVKVTMYYESLWISLRSPNGFYFLKIQSASAKNI